MTPRPTSTDPLWMRFAMRFGVGALIAVGLTTFLVQTVAADLRDIKKAVADHVTGSERQLLLLEAICINTAKTEVERNSCRGAR